MAELLVELRFDTASKQPCYHVLRNGEEDFSGFKDLKEDTVIGSDAGWQVIIQADGESITEIDNLVVNEEKRDQSKNWQDIWEQIPQAGEYNGRPAWIGTVKEGIGTPEDPWFNGWTLYYTTADGTKRHLDPDWEVPPA